MTISLYELRRWDSIAANYFNENRFDKAINFFDKIIGNADEIKRNAANAPTHELRILYNAYLHRSEAHEKLAHLIEAEADRNQVNQIKNEWGFTDDNSLSEIIMKSTLDALEGRLAYVQIQSQNQRRALLSKLKKPGADDTQIPDSQVSAMSATQPVSNDKREAIIPEAAAEAEAPEPEVVVPPTKISAAGNPVQTPIKDSNTSVIGFFKNLITRAPEPNDKKAKERVEQIKASIQLDPTRLEDDDPDCGL